MGNLEDKSFISHKTPEDAKYIESIDFVSAWTKDGIKEINPKAIVDQDTNKNSGGKYICPVINYTNDINNAVSDLKLIGWWHKEDEAPAGYTKIKQDLNEGVGGKYFYLCYSKEGKQKITDISFYYRHTKANLEKKELKGWRIVPQDINIGVKGICIYFVYKTDE